MKVVVIGAGGRAGTAIVRRLTADGHHAVPASRSTGVDAVTGEGLADVLVGADVVVDAASAPVPDDDAVMRFFVDSTRTLLAAERATRASATISR
jgi:putative NADH-flavin reductase